MAKQTLTKMHRKFIGRVVNIFKNGRVEERIEMAKRYDPVNVFPSQQQPCRMCGKDMTVAQGQFARFHAKCRAKVRKFKNQGKPE